MPDSKRFLHPEAVKRISRMELRARHIVEGFLSGMHRSPYFGQSVEFQQHREYVTGDDLRHGKHNAVIGAFRTRDPDDAAVAAVEAVWGQPEVSDEAVAAAADVLAGAKADVEKRLAFLADQATSALRRSPFDDEAKEMLEEVTRRLTDRGS